MDRVDGEQGGVGLGFGMVEEVDVDELLDLERAGGDVLHNGSEILQAWLATIGHLRTAKEWRTVSETS